MICRKKKKKKKSSHLSNRREGNGERNKKLEKERRKEMIKRVNWGFDDFFLLVSVQAVPLISFLCSDPTDACGMVFFVCCWFV